MATTLTYASLLDDMRAYSDRGRTGDTTIRDQLPRLINSAERAIITDAKLQGYERTLTQSLEAGKSVYAKPDRFRETISVAIVQDSARRPLFARSYEYVRSYWPDESETALPLFYADHGTDNWLIGPTPDAAYGMEIKIYQLPELLSEANQTNWLTDEAPTMLRYRAMMELAVLSKDPQRAAEFRELYRERLAAFMGEDMAKIMDRAATRDSV